MNRSLDRIKSSFAQNLIGDHLFGFMVSKISFLWEI